ncbi:hypothetical protein [Nocardia sp. NPDC050412]|uniref:hypothetical protein n=1 Tax=Nocardia sp. NPDC050412 TaxID=3364320 RepID=UPI0037ACB42F
MASGHFCASFQCLVILGRARGFVEDIAAGRGGLQPKVLAGHRTRLLAPQRPHNLDRFSALTSHVVGYGFGGESLDDDVGHGGVGEDGAGVVFADFVGGWSPRISDQKPAELAEITTRRVRSVRD